MNTVNSSSVMQSSQARNGSGSNYSGSNDSGSAVMATNMGWSNLGLKLWDSTQNLVNNGDKLTMDRGLSAGLLSKERAASPLFAVKASIKNAGQSTNLQLISSESQSRIVLNPDGSIELGHSWSQQIFDVFQQSLSKFDSLIADALQRVSDSWSSLSSPSSLTGPTEALAEPLITGPTSGVNQAEPSRSISEAPQNKLPTLKKPKTLPKMGDFLWKPVADKDGKLVVLLPSKLTGDVNRVRLLSPDGKQVIAQSKFSGIGNGDRGHYRFSKPGAEYPPNTKVEIIMDDGNRYRVNIPSTGRRMTQ